jgi:hypothetical protein
VSRPVFNVYVDEVFEHFMNLPRMDGYFCYASIMVDEKTEGQLKAFWNALENRLKNAYRRATGFWIKGEFKSTYLRKLTLEDRSDAAKRIAYFLRKNGGFIAGYYTTVHGLMCWELRSSAGFEDADKLPPYDVGELEKKAAQLRAEKKKGFGESQLLQGLFHTIASVPLSWLGVLPANFRICYDSRNPKEDRVLLKLCEEFFPRMAEIEPDRMAAYLGGQGHPDSSQVPGLMLADIICKELRDFVQAAPEILVDQSEWRMITPTSREGYPLPVEIGGRTMKWGAAKLMSPSTAQKLHELRQTVPFSFLLPCLADFKLSCYGHFGEGRIVDFVNEVFHDQVD